MKKIKKEITLTVTLNEYISKDKTSLLVDKKGLLSLLKSTIKETEEGSKEEIINRDNIYDFLSFKVDEEKLLTIYDEQNKKTYPHFVYHFLRKFYTTSEGCQYWMNGGNFIYSDYDPRTLLHNRMVTGELRSYGKDYSVRDRILLHLVSAKAIRVYGIGASYKMVKLKTHQDLIDFFDFILNSKMIEMYSKESLSLKGECLLDKEFSDAKIFLKKKEFTAVHLIYQCWRSYDLKALKYLIDSRNLDLYKLDELLKPEPLGVLGIFVNLFYYEIKSITEKNRYKKDYNSYIEFMTFVATNYPNLELKYSDVRYLDSTVFRFDDKKDFINTVIKSDRYKENVFFKEVLNKIFKIQNN